jgi:hypothetical protein
MKLRPSWESPSCAATIELPSILWNPKVHLNVHKSPPLVPILSQIDPVHITPIYPSKIHFNIVHPYILVFLVASFLLAFPPISYMHSSSPHSCYMHRPAHPAWLGHSNYTWQRVQIMKLLIMQFFPTTCHFIPLRYEQCLLEYVYIRIYLLIDR